jgi:tRNA modification GTPase
VIRVSGPDAPAILSALTGGRCFAPRRLTLARLRAPSTGALLDRAMVCRLPGPRSLTGEEVVELHAHGGRLNLERLMRQLHELGARQAAPGEFTRRAFENGRIDLDQAEAVQLLVSARSDRALRNAQRLLDGELGRGVRSIARRVLELAAILEVSIDFSEDAAFEGDGLEAARELFDECARGVGRLAGTYPGARGPEEATVVIAGPTNAGKSSLFNALLGAERALVSEEPGTTRDYIEAEWRLGGVSLRLVDTAGVRASSEGSPLEASGRALARPLVESCDLLLYVVDLTSDTSEVLRGAAETRTARTVLVLGNKLDLAGGERLELLGAGGAEAPLGISAKTGEGLEALRLEVERRLGLSEETEEGVRVAVRRHWEALSRAHTALEEGRAALDAGVPPEFVVEHVRAALSHLDEISGRPKGEDVLDALFSTFCIGK